MEWYAASSAGTRKELAIKSDEDLKDERVLYAVLIRSGVLDGKFDYAAFYKLVERALEEEMPGYDYHDVLAGIESVMTQLGVMPFDEALLPPEDPKTF